MFHSYSCFNFKMAIFLVYCVANVYCVIELALVMKHSSAPVWFSMYLEVAVLFTLLSLLLLDGISHTKPGQS